MAYDRAERFPKLISSTPCNVGPGSYDVSDYVQNLKNSHPFLSSTKRMTVSVSKDAQQLPGPGFYNINDIQRHIPGGVSIDFTDARFKKQVNDGPGPAEYDINNNLSDRVVQKIRVHPGTWKGSPGKLWLIPPPRSRVTSAVSVPSKQDANGYSIDKRDRLVKNPPEIQEPNFLYNVPREEIHFNTRRYKGNFWSRMTGRQTAKTPVTPGPGDYEHETKKSPAELQSERIRAAKRASSKQPRYLDALYTAKLRENLPAPNAYNPLKSNVNKSERRLCRNKSCYWKPPPFGTTAQRFECRVYYETPGPGSYELDARRNCSLSIYAAPFGSCSPRLRNLPDKTGPGPSDYHTEVGNLAFDSAKRFKSDWTRARSTKHADTVRNPINQQRNDVPYYFFKNNEVKKCAVYHAAFKSRTERFPSNHKQAKLPDPGTYEVPVAFKANRDRCDFLCRRLAPPFDSRADRFPKQPSGVNTHVPGATCYDLSADISKNVKGGVIAYPRRRKEETANAPGPAHYNVNPLIGSSIAKKTFNITLEKPKSLLVLRKINVDQNPQTFPQLEEKRIKILKPNNICVNYVHAYN